MSDQQNMIIHLVAGGLAGTTGAVLTCPLEVVKTRLQANQSACKTTRSGGGGGGGGGVGDRFNSAPKSHQNLTNRATRLTTSLNSYTNILLRNNHLSHSTSACGNQLMASNLFNIESTSSQLKTTRINSATEFSRTLPSRISIYLQLKLIIKNEGFAALFKGLGPNIVGVAPYRAIYFFSYANAKSFLSPYMGGSDRPALHISSAFAAGFTAVTITNPIWFVKTRMQLDQSRRGVSATSVISKILREKGPLGFYKGISASYVGTCESAIYFFIYEQLKLISADNSPDKNLTLINYFTSAGFAKTLAACICYPHEVARTRLRLEGDKYKSFLQTISLIVREEGARGLYKGMATHLIRQIPNTAIVMTTYELIVNHFTVTMVPTLLASNQDD